jgi:hypothetical protein
MKGNKKTKEKREGGGSKKLKHKKVEKGLHLDRRNNLWLPEKGNSNIFTTLSFCFLFSL